jgi:hypothetical protein
MRASTTHMTSISLSNTHTTDGDVTTDMTTDNELKLEANRAETELREVCRYMRQERQSLQEKLSQLNLDNRHLKASLESSQRSLTEVKVELKIELDKSFITKEDDDFDNLLTSVSHLNELKEKNSILFLENNELNIKISHLSMQLKEMKNSFEPLKKINIENIDKIDSLESINLSVVIERDQVNERLQTLISRYKDVDPEIHRQLVIVSEEKTADYQVLETRHKENESHAIKLRNYLSQYKTSAKENSNQLESLKKLNEELNVTITSNNEQIKNLQTQTSENQGKFNKLTTQKDSIITNLQNQLLSLQKQNNTKEYKDSETSSSVKTSPIPLVKTVSILFFILYFVL